MSKIAPFNGRFHDVKSILAAIAEDDGATGFCGCVLTKNEDGEPILKTVSIGINRNDMALASLMIGANAVDDDK